MEESRAKSRSQRLNARQVELLIDAIAIAMASPNVLSEIFGAEGETERKDALTYLALHLTERHKQLTFK